MCDQSSLDLVLLLLLLLSFFFPLHYQGGCPERSVGWHAIRRPRSRGPPGCARVWSVGGRGRGWWSGLWGARARGRSPSRDRCAARPTSTRRRSPAASPCRAPRSSAEACTSPTRSVAGFSVVLGGRGGWVAQRTVVCRCGTSGCALSLTRAVRLPASAKPHRKWPFRSSCPAAHSTCRRVRECCGVRASIAAASIGVMR